MKRILLSVATLVLLTQTSFGQATKRKCTASELHQHKLITDANYAKARLQIDNLNQNFNFKSNTVYTIPVVIHVIHNGESVGTGQNISDAQIMSQLTALNKDFKKTNTDTLKPSHAFYSLQGDPSIEFCLAKQDENGNATTGIIRYNKGQADWEAASFDSQVKPNTAWDRTKYLNIWVTTMGGEDATTLGYATFPGTNDATDGVVIDYKAFGTTGNVNQGTDLGRTATHEVGHYLNLYHIWGDAECGDDQVSDTPTQLADNSGCPTFPHNANSKCGTDANGEMYMNFMDYVDDNCMVMFSAGQATRMRTALTGARNSLTQSTGCNVPTGININTISNLVKVYPNPVQDMATIEFPNSFQVNTVEILSANGQVVKSLNSSNSIGKVGISTSDLSNGTYFVKLIGNNGVATKEIIIVK